MSETETKLDLARQEISNQLTNIAQNLSSQQSPSKFLVPEIDILKPVPSSHIYSCSGDESEVEVEGYRCKCSFQLVGASRSLIGEQNTRPNDLIYCIRENGNIIPLKDGIFSPANRRIQLAMNCLLKALNTIQSDGYEFYGARNNLTSVTFVSSWGDGSHLDEINKPEKYETTFEALGDCHVTLHYGPPGMFNPCKSDHSETKNAQYNELNWKEESQKICNMCNISSLTARSKGIKLVTLNTAMHRNESEQCVIHDDLWMVVQQDVAHKVSSVSLVPPSFLNIDTSYQITVKIRYQKTTEAFQHPNAGVMLTSLHWILNTLSQISKELSKSCTDISTSSIQKPRLLEMYCGCGAHTIPCAKSGILSEIVAVELDERLVTACKKNCSLNSCLKGESYGAGTSVTVFNGDAATWAKKILASYSKQHGSTSNSHHCALNEIDFDILLVDPPREGLDRSVCNLALKGDFRHFIYVSCGRRALLRDLEVLCIGGYEVANLCIVDLFPGTDAVETLVHLKRDT